MTTITNKTPKPLSVPLPGGKKLFLGPGKSGQIAAKAAAHPPLKALVDAGELELVSARGSYAGHKGGAGGAAPHSQVNTTGKNIRRRGDV